MRILVTLPHVFHTVPGTYHGSMGTDADGRAAALEASIVALRSTFDKRQYMLRAIDRSISEVNTRHAAEVDVAICTTQDLHLLDRLELPPGSYTHHPTTAAPRMLGFECQAVLRDALGGYDYYCYMEDDLTILDPLFFLKLAWFTDEIGNESLLQPNRYECDALDGGRKAYIDGDLSPARTAPFQDINDTPVVSLEVLGSNVTFRRPLNPHAGAYFLNAAQMATWAQQPYFLDRDTSFIGRLESAATLGIMRTFKVYKPAPELASFLEIKHAGRAFISQVQSESEETQPLPAGEPR